MEAYMDGSGYNKYVFPIKPPQSHRPLLRLILPHFRAKIDFSRQKENLLRWGHCKTAAIAGPTCRLHTCCPPPDRAFSQRGREAGEKWLLAQPLLLWCLIPACTCSWIMLHGPGRARAFLSRDFSPRYVSHTLTAGCLSGAPLTTFQPNCQNLCPEAENVRGVL